MSSEPVIEVRGLGKAYHIFDRPQDRFKQMLSQGRRQYYRPFEALHDVSFSVGSGETVGIIGRNGSGKSTLLQIICGTLEQSAGEVIVRGKVAALLELGAGFNPEFTGRENVALNASVLGLSNEQIAERFDDIVAFADIGEFLDQPVKTYSSGMVVRLAFAVIAHVDADILVIDEALAVGDAYFVQKCLRFLRKFSQEGTLLFVSHDTTSVMGLCDRAVWLERGAVRDLGPARDIVGDYLEGLYKQQDGEGLTRGQADKSRSAAAPEQEYRDQRDALINGSNLRNDIALQPFDEGAEELSDGSVEIVDVAFLDNGERLSWMVGGEQVSLRISYTSTIDLQRPMIGFKVKNRLGLGVFGDNTDLSFRDNPVPTPAGKLCVATFDFTMPRLPSGEYMLDVAISDGVQENNRMLNWKYDVLVLRVEASHIVHGMVGVPMKSIRLEVEDPK